MGELTCAVGLPANLTAEKTILGAVLLDNGQYYAAAEMVEPDDFSLDSHRRIFLRMGELLDLGRPVDGVSLCEELARNKEIEMVGGWSYVADLTSGVPRRVVIREYARIVKDKSLLRQLIGISDAAISRASDQSSPALEVLGAAMEQMEQAAATLRTGAKEIAETLPGTLMRFMEEARSPKGEILGANLLTPEIDNLTSGIMPGELCLIAGRPGQGKTEAAIQIAVRNARRGLRVHFQSLEMSRTQLERRLLRYMARVEVRKARDPRTLFPNEIRAITDAADELVGLPLSIDDEHELTTTDFRSRSVLAAKRWKADLLILDYGQLLLVPRAKNAVEEAKKQAEALRHIARDYCRTVAVAQLRRAPPQDMNKYPDMEDILGSSSWEQAAQIILLLHRTREEKLYTGEDFCFLAKMRELQQLDKFGIKANPWGGFVDRYTETAPHWSERQ